VPQVSVRPARAPQQPPAARLSEPPSCPPPPCRLPPAMAHLNAAIRRRRTHRARLGGCRLRRGPRGPRLPPRAARRKVRGSRDSSNSAPNETSPGAAAAHSRAFRTSQVPLRGWPPAARARRPTSPASPPPPAAQPPTSPRGARSSRARCAHCDRARPRAPGAVTAPRRSRRHATQSPRLRRPRLTQSCSARSRRCRCRRAAAIARRHLRPRERAVHAWCSPMPIARCVCEKVRRSLRDLISPAVLLVTSCDFDASFRLRMHEKPGRQVVHHFLQSLCVM